MSKSPSYSVTIARASESWEFAPGCRLGVEVSSTRKRAKCTVPIEVRAAGRIDIRLVSLQRRDDCRYARTRNDWHDEDQRISHSASSRVEKETIRDEMPYSQTSSGMHDR